MNGKNNQFRFLWLALFAGLTFFSLGRWQIFAVAWLPAIFAIRFYRSSEKGGRAFLWLWLATAVPTIIAWRNATAMHFMGPVVEPVFFGIVTAIAIIPYIVDRLYHRRWARNGRSPFWLTLIFPISVTGMDFFSSSGSPFGSFGAAAYSQAGFTALMQITAVTGMWIIPFIISWFASVANYIWENDFQWQKINRGVLTFVGVLVLIFGFGFGRMAMADSNPQTVQIGGFSLPEEGFVSTMTLLQENDEATFREAVTELHQQQLEQVRVMAQDGAKIVVLQEGAGMGFAEEVDALLANAAIVAQEEGIYLVLPTALIGEEPFHNVVRIIDPNGEIVLEHYKYGGTQFEGSVAGSGELQTIETPYGKLSAVICWDADFPVTMQQAGEQEVDLLFVPSNDWFELRDIHAGMATFRAVENGVPIYRQTGAGVSSVIDAYGRLLNRVDIFEEEDAGDWGGVQMVETAVGSVNTLYPTVSDAFGAVMLLGFVGLLIFGWVKRKG